MDFGGLRACLARSLANVVGQVLFSPASFADRSTHTVSTTVLLSRVFSALIDRAFG